MDFSNDKLDGKAIRCMRFSSLKMTLVCDYNVRAHILSRGDWEKNVPNRIVVREKTTTDAAAAVAVTVCDKRVKEKSNRDERVQKR